MATATLTKPELQQTNIQATTRLLLTLWDLGGAEVKKSDLMKRIRSKGQNYSKILAQLEEEDAIAVSGKRSQTISLSNKGEQILEQGLRSDDFGFDSSVGASTANALLKWLRQSKPASAPATNGKAEITSYEEFKAVALEVYDRLDRDYNMDNLVPIYRIRREIGERVARSQFNKWLLEMQASDVLQLLEGSVEDSAPDKIEDSIMTKVSGLRCYARRLDI